MTAQIGDLCKFENEEYAILAYSDENYFVPQSYGLEPHAIATCCYRGYFSEYAVEDEEFLLKNLYIYNRDGAYPPLNGVEPEPREYYEDNLRRKKKREKIQIPKHMGHRVYRNICLRVPYTGKILIGKDFIREYYIHMGFQRAWSYRKLAELTVDEGLLMASRDVSGYAEEKRREMLEKKEDPHKPINESEDEFVGRCFSLDYADKVWCTEFPF